MNTDSKFKIERMHVLNSESSTKAFCDILLYDTFIVKGLRVVKGKDGLFVSSIEAFFSTKDSSQPVQCQIRTMVNGYPTTTILPFGISVVNGSSIST